MYSAVSLMTRRVSCRDFYISSSAAAWCASISSLDFAFWSLSPTKDNESSKGAVSTNLSPLNRNIAIVPLPHQSPDRRPCEALPKTPIDLEVLHLTSRVILPINSPPQPNPTTSPVPHSNLFSTTCLGKVNMKSPLLSPTPISSFLFAITEETWRRCEKGRERRHVRGVPIDLDVGIFTERPWNHCQVSEDPRVWFTQYGPVPRDAVPF